MAAISKARKAGTEVADLRAEVARLKAEIKRLRAAAAKGA